MSNNTFRFKNFYKEFSSCINARNDITKFCILYDMEEMEDTDPAVISRTRRGQQAVPRKWIRKIMYEGLEQIEKRFALMMTFDSNNNQLLFEDMIQSKIMNFCQNSKYNLEFDESFYEKPTEGKLAYLFFTSIINESFAKNSDSEIEKTKTLKDTKKKKSEMSKAAEDSVNHKNGKIERIKSSQSFFEACIQEGEIKEVRLAFHTGWYWGIDRDKIQWLTYFMDHNIPVKVITNPMDAVKTICTNMRNRFMNYSDIDREIDAWNQRSLQFPNIQYQICKIPILRRYNYVQFKDGDEVASVKDYLYFHESKMIDNKERIIGMNDPGFDLYRSEFEYLWDGVKDGKRISVPYHSYQRKIERPLDNATYALYYHTSRKGRDDKLVLSKLEIHDDHTASMITNLSGRVQGEYFYTGHAESVGNILYVFLEDEYHFEQLSLTLARSVPKINRCVGLLTGLTPANDPLSTKCVCIPYEQRRDVDEKKLIDYFEANVESDMGHYSIIMDQEQQNNIFSEEL